MTSHFLTEPPRESGGAPLDSDLVIEEMNNTNHDLKSIVAEQKAVIAETNSTLVDLMVKMAELNSTFAKQKGNNYSILVLSYCEKSHRAFFIMRTVM